MPNEKPNASTEEVEEVNEQEETEGETTEGGKAEVDDLEGLSDEEIRALASKVKVYQKRAGVLRTKLQAAQAAAAAAKPAEKTEGEEATKLAEAQARIAALEADLKAGAAEKLKTSALVAAGLDPKLAKYLPTTDDETEIEEAIEELLEDFKPKTVRQKNDSSASGPKSPVNSSKQLTAADLEKMSDEDVVKAQKEGLLDELMGFKK